MTLFNSSPADVIQSCKSIPDKAAINLPHVVNRVTDPLPPPTECPFCAGGSAGGLRKGTGTAPRGIPQK